MIEKTKNILKIIIVLFICGAVIYGIISMIINIGKEPDIISSDEIALYLIDSNVVDDYTTYYYIEACFENLIEGTKKDKYNELYDIYIKDYKDLYTEEEITAKLSEFSSEENAPRIYKVYNAGRLYIVEYILNENTGYMFIELGANKNSDYNFAIVK